jgi:multiple sugar transport system permease protein
MASRLRSVTHGITIVLVLIWSLFPLYWAAKTSLSTLSSAESRPPHYLPTPFTGTSYETLLGLKPSNSGIVYQFGKSILNSVIEAGGTTVLTVLVAVMAAYAFARLKLHFKRIIFASVIGTLLLPTYATLIPLYRLMSSWGLVNTYIGLILVYTASFLPLAVWILYTYFLSLPIDIEEAASIDGATSMQTLMRVVIPLAGPGIAAAAIISFLLSWSQFLVPLVLTSDLSAQPVTVIVASLDGERVVPFTLMMAVAVLAAAPPGIVALVLNRRLVQGLTAGSVK